MRGILMIGLVLATPCAAKAQDALARHLFVFGFPGLPARDGRPAVPGTELTPEVIAIVQRCKDSVMAGNRYAPRPDRPPQPVHPPGLAPDARVVMAAEMIDGCVVEQKLPGVHVSPSLAPLGRPLLR